MFRLLFSYNPLPTWVQDNETLRFLEVNDAAVRQYGYSQDEFKSMTVLDIRSDEEKVKYLEHSKQWSGAGRYQGNWKHRKKDGKIFEGEITSHQLEHAGTQVRLWGSQAISERHLLHPHLPQPHKPDPACLPP